MTFSQNDGPFTTYGMWSSCKITLWPRAYACTTKITERNAKINSSWNPRTFGKRGTALVRRDLCNRMLHIWLQPTARVNAYTRNIVKVMPNGRSRLIHFQSHNLMIIVEYLSIFSGLTNSSTTIQFIWKYGISKVEMYLTMYLIFIGRICKLCLKVF